MAEQKLMKDGLDARAVTRIAKALRYATKNFPVDQFQKQALSGLSELELKERVRHVIDVLAQHVPADFAQTAKILINVKRHWDHGDESDPLRGFAAWPLIDYVGVYGIDHPQAALGVLKTLTSLFSSEFAIRPFLCQHFDLTYRHLTDWCNDSDPHVRRLVSEGTRPRLPWGMRLPQFIDDPQPVVALLDKLKDDSSEYVRRSVANNLNDIAKDNPDLVIKICRKWQKKASDNRRWVIRHATRGLVKSGHPDVFPLLGYTESPDLTVRSLALNKKRVQLGGALAFTFTVDSLASVQQRVVLDYAIHFLKSNGRTSPKVFKLKNITLEPGGSIQLDKAHSLAKITTRKYYTGKHALEILVNGVSYGKIEFSLIAA